MPVLIHNIGRSPSSLSHIKSNYNTKKEVLACPDLLTFDGVYSSVYKHKDILKPSILFVVGDYIGKDNSFDTGMPHETFCTWEQLKELESEGHTLGWHTHSHPDLTKLSYQEAKKEMTAPWPCTDFAYPFGKFNNSLIEIAKELGYQRAWAVTVRNETQYSLRRKYL